MQEDTPILSPPYKGSRTFSILLLLVLIVGFAVVIGLGVAILTVGLTVLFVIAVS
jgi:hypothetical protein